MMDDRILYCNIGWMAYYDGAEGNDDESESGSDGTHRDDREMNNFTYHDGNYFEFIHARHDTMDIQKHFHANKDAAFVDGVTVVWVSEKNIVGYYRDARVYRKP